MSPGEEKLHLDKNAGQRRQRRGSPGGSSWSVLLTQPYNNLNLTFCSCGEKQVWMHYGQSIAKCFPNMAPVQITIYQTQCKAYVILKESPVVVHVPQYSDVDHEIWVCHSVNTFHPSLCRLVFFVI